jgi:hypothetical protein
VSAPWLHHAFSCALLSLSVATWSACTGGPISDFPTAGHGDKDPSDEDNGASVDAGPSGAPGGDGDAESPDDGPVVDMDGGVASDAGAPDAGDAAVDASTDAAADASAADASP